MSPAYTWQGAGDVRRQRPQIEEAGPSTPVEIIGLSDIPGAGDPFQVTEDERQARQVGAKRQELERLGTAAM
jgi:translation initiation factor IF-2